MQKKKTNSQTNQNKQTKKPTGRNQFENKWELDDFRLTSVKFIIFIT